MRRKERRQDGEIKRHQQEGKMIRREEVEKETKNARR